jgi:hypothetical protein
MDKPDHQKHMVKYLDFVVHTDHCGYGETKCVMKNCDWRGPRQDFAKHLLTKADTNPEIDVPELTSKDYTWKTSLSWDLDEGMNLAKFKSPVVYFVIVRRDGHCLFRLEIGAGIIIVDSVSNGGYPLQRNDSDEFKVSLNDNQYSGLVSTSYHWTDYSRMPSVNQLFLSDNEGNTHSDRAIFPLSPCLDTEKRSIQLDLTFKKV